MSDIKKSEYKHARYKLTYKLITPIHIGTGDVLDPLSYAIDSDNVFHRFKIENLISSFDEGELKEFTDIARGGNLSLQRKFIRKYYDTYDMSEIDSYSFRVEKDIADWYKKRIGQQTSLLEIHPVIRVGDDGAPYIPGSTIKGALRTALLDGLLASNQIAQRELANLPVRRNKTTNKEEPSDKKRHVEGVILNCWKQDKKSFDVIQDPFKYLKVSDAFFPEGEKNVIMGKVVNTGNKGDGVEQYCEVICPKNSDKTSVVAQGNVTIAPEFGNKIASIDKISQICTLFYKSTLKADSHRPEWVSKRIESQAKDQFPLCIGRFTGKHFKTYTNAKDKYPGTRNLFKNSFPMGWIMVQYKRLI